MAAHAGVLVELHLTPGQKYSQAQEQILCQDASQLRTTKSASPFTNALNLLRIRASGVGGSLSPS